MHSLCSISSSLSSCFGQTPCRQYAPVGRWRPSSGPPVIVSSAPGTLGCGYRRVLGLTVEAVDTYLTVMMLMIEKKMVTITSMPGGGSAHSHVETLWICQNKDTQQRFSANRSKG